MSEPSAALPLDAPLLLSPLSSARRHHQPPSDPASWARRLFALTVQFVVLTVVIAVSTLVTYGCWSEILRGIADVPFLIDQ